MTPGRDRDPLLAGGLPTQYVDVDPDETAEWVESFDNVVDQSGNYRARYLMLSLLRRGKPLPPLLQPWPRRLRRACSLWLLHLPARRLPRP